jgi:hypothetical protein
MITKGVGRANRVDIAGERAVRYALVDANAISAEAQHRI